VGFKVENTIPSKTSHQLSHLACQCHFKNNTVQLNPTAHEKSPRRLAPASASTSTCPESQGDVATPTTHSTQTLAGRVKRNLAGPNTAPKFFRKSL